jgi:hypothetical protein
MYFYGIARYESLKTELILPCRVRESHARKHSQGLD